MQIHIKLQNKEILYANKYNYTIHMVLFIIIGKK